MVLSGALELLKEDRSLKTALVCGADNLTRGQKRAGEMPSQRHLLEVALRKTFFDSRPRGLTMTVACL